MVREYGHFKKDKKNPGVLSQDVRRSNFHMHLASLVGYEVISMKDLDGFSDETMRQLMLSLTTFSRIKEQGVFMPIPRIITSQVSIFARSLG